jgi:hypothetical protein
LKDVMMGKYRYVYNPREAQAQRHKCYKCGKLAGSDPFYYGSSWYGWNY